MKKADKLPSELTEEQRIAELDRLAREGSAMPPYLTQAEQFFFQSVRSLCLMVRAKLIPDKQAQGEYRKIRRAYDRSSERERGEREQMGRIERATEALTMVVRQDGCPICRETLRVLLGLRGKA